MTRPPALERLCEQFPLPGGYQLSETFSDDLCLGALQLSMVGLVADHPDGDRVVGSAAGPGAAPWDRAYYELLERTSIKLARMREGDALVVRDADSGEPLDRMPHAVVFADAEAGDGTRLSMSNGVALHSRWSEAGRRARCELAERDGVLATFWDGAPIAPLPVPDEPPLAALAERYEVEAYQLGDGGALGLPAVGVFAFPRDPSDPLVYGFGGGGERAAALAAASREALQRLAFLWGEAIPEDVPDESATPDYHQEFYLVPAHRALLRTWLRDGQASAKTAQPLLPATHVQLVDLTPPELSGRLWVAKAMADGIRPLRFGPRLTRSGRPVPSARRVHPIV